MADSPQTDDLTDKESLERAEQDFRAGRFREEQWRDGERLTDSPQAELEAAREQLNHAVEAYRSTALRAGDTTVEWMAVLRARTALEEKAIAEWDAGCHDALRKTAERAELDVANLLARIFRDGGQRADAYPSQSHAVEAADREIAALFVERDAAWEALRD